MASDVPIEMDGLISALSLLITSSRPICIPTNTLQPGARLCPKWEFVYPLGTVCLGTLLDLCRFNFAQLLVGLTWFDHKCFFGSFSAKMPISVGWQLEPVEVSIRDQLVCWVWKFVGLALLVRTGTDYPRYFENSRSANYQLVPVLIVFWFWVQ